MRDAQNIKDIVYVVDGERSNATEAWMAENGEVYITLRKNGCNMNVNVKDIHKYIKDDNTRDTASNVRGDSTR
jgi:hypothetical protein